MHKIFPILELRGSSYKNT